MVAERNVAYTKEILKTVGVSPERVQMFHCSAAEGQKFQEEATRISETIQKLGSNPFKDSIKSEKEEKESKKKKTE
ncbi:MAG: hydrogenase iron-sulfur subunit [Candidatus Lokiarchaeota archaeon]|nr:hydrogenase iron-sulfur subunit [Candidatus Lokiarchaeota archaeon]